MFLFRVAATQGVGRNAILVPPIERQFLSGECHRKTRYGIGVPDGGQILGLKVVVIREQGLAGLDQGAVGESGLGVKTPLDPRLDPCGREDLVRRAG